MIESRPQRWLLALVPSAGLLLAALTAPAGAEDWPRYRGARQDGTSSETGLLAAWPEEGPPEIWRVPLGDGYSGISVADDRVYTQFGADGDELAVSLDAGTGREIWRVRIDADRPDSQGGGPRSTPTVDDDLVYVLSARGKLAALKAANGGFVWRVDLVKEHGARVPQWGVSTSPLVEGDLLLIDAGGRNDRGLLALDKTTGELRWGSQSDPAGYSTPLAVTIGGVPQVLFFTARALVAVALDDGALLWRHPWRTSWDVNAAMPIFLPPDKVFLSSAYDTGAALLEVRRDDAGFEAGEVWRNRVMQNQFNSSVLVGDHLYGFSKSILKCVEVATGREMWAARGFGRGSLLYADGSLIVLGESGQLAKIEATPDDYREQARTRAFQTRTWTMPTLAEGRLYVRSELELAAFDLRPRASR